MKKKPLIILIIILLSSIGLLYWSNNKQIKNNLTVSGTVQASEVKFGSRQSGRISSVLVQEGQGLKKGQIILTLDAAEIQAQILAMKANIQAQAEYIRELKNGTRSEQIEAARANYKKANAEYELSKNGYRQEDIKAAQATMKAAESEMIRAKQNAQRRENLFKEQLISRDQLEIAQNQLLVTSKHFEETKENYQKLLNGSRKEDVQKNLYAAQAQKANYLDLLKGTRPEKLAAESQRLAVYQAQLEELQTKQNELSVSSPCNCELSEFEIKPGSLVLANQVLGTLIDLNDLWVDAYLPQEVYGRILPGDPVEIKALTYPKKKFIGRVKFVGLKAEFTPRNIQTIEGRKQEVFKVKVAINNAERLFRPGMDLDLRFNFRKENL